MSNSLQTLLKLKQELTDLIEKQAKLELEIQTFRCEMESEALKKIRGKWWIKMCESLQRVLPSLVQIEHHILEVDLPQQNGLPIRVSFSSKISFPFSDLFSNASLPRVWKLLSFLFGHSIRIRVYEPTVEEMLEDLLVARRSFRTRGARGWLIIYFTVRTIFVVFDCTRLSLLQPLYKLFPARLKQWWNLFS